MLELVAMRSRRAQPFDKAVGKNLKALRALHGMSQTDLAGKIGVSYQQYGKYESGTDRMSFYRAALASQVLGVSIEDLGNLNGRKIKLPTKPKGDK